MAATLLNGYNREKLPVRGAMLIVALTWGSPALAQHPSAAGVRSYEMESPLQLGRSSFALPVVEYRAPDGTWKRSSGIIVGHDISPNATVGIGFFRAAPKNQGPPVQTVGKSRKVSLGFSLRF